MPRDYAKVAATAPAGRISSESLISRNGAGPPADDLDRRPRSSESLHSAGSSNPGVSPTRSYGTYRSVTSAADDEDDEEDVAIEIYDEWKPTGSFASSCINIGNTILGSGMLAMPSALARVGLGFGIVLIGLSGTAAAFGLLLLSEIASKVGRTSSFNSCAKITYPGAAVWFDVAIAVKCFGVSISYLVICGDLLPRVILGFHPEVSPDSLLLSKTFWLIACLLLVSPLCFLRRLDSLRYTSGFALLSVIYLVFIVVTYFFAPQEGMPPHVHWDEIKWFKLDRHFFGVIPIFVFAFTCHQNIFSVYNELIENEHKRMRKVVVTSVGTAFFVYQTVAVLGYLTFGNTVSSNIIGQYPANALITGGQLAIVFLVLLSYPLQCHPARASLDKIITNLQSHRCAVDEVPALPGEIGRTRWVAMTLGLMGSSLLLALVLHNLATVLAFVGATGSTTICYILPGLFYYKYSTQEDRESDRPARFNPKRAGAIFLGCFGVVIMITSLVTLGVTGEGGH